MHVKLQLNFLLILSFAVSPVSGSDRTTVKKIGGKCFTTLNVYTKSNRIHRALRNRTNQTSQSNPSLDLFNLSVILFEKNKSNKTFCIFQMEIIVKVRATTLNNKMIATGTPRTRRSAFPFKIQQNTSASTGRKIKFIS